MIDLISQKARCYNIDIEKLGYDYQATGGLLKLLYEDSVMTDVTGKKTREADLLLYLSKQILYYLQTTGTKEPDINRIHYLVLNALYTGIELGRKYPLKEKVDVDWAKADQNYLDNYVVKYINNNILFEMEKDINVKSFALPSGKLITFKVTAEPVNL